MHPREALASSKTHREVLHGGRSFTRSSWLMMVEALLISYSSAIRLWLPSQASSQTPRIGLVAGLVNRVWIPEPHDDGHGVGLRSWGSAAER